MSSKIFIGVCMLVSFTGQVHANVLTGNGLTGDVSTGIVLRENALGRDLLTGNVFRGDIFSGSGAVSAVQYSPALYRLVDHRSYRILDTTGLCLYRINKLVQGEKIARPEDVYYFSVRPDSPLMELTRVNLEKAFAGNDRFRYELESLFHTDRELIAYDNLSKIYKIQYVYRKSL